MVPNSSWTHRETSCKNGLAWKQFERLVSQVTDDCIIWPYSVIKKGGYGRIRSGKKTLQVHRVAYMKFRGAIPENTCVLHRCDTPRCFNPRHLFLGTDDDNRNDMITKRRHAHCESHGMAKLNWETVAKIRAEYVYGSKSQGQAALGK